MTFNWLSKPPVTISSPSPESEQALKRSEAVFWKSSAPVSTLNTLTVLAAPATSSVSPLSLKETLRGRGGKHARFFRTGSTAYASGRGGGAGNRHRARTRKPGSDRASETLRNDPQNRRPRLRLWRLHPQVAECSRLNSHWDGARTVTKEEEAKQAPRTCSRCARMAACACAARYESYRRRVRACLVASCYRFLRSPRQRQTRATFDAPVKHFATSRQSCHTATCPMRRRPGRLREHVVREARREQARASAERFRAHGYVRARVTRAALLIGGR